MKEFMDFLNEQKIIAVALAFIVGYATVTLVQALVNDLITPIYSPYLGFLDPNAAVQIGLSKFMVGDFIRQLVNWIIVLFVVFILGTRVFKSSKK